MPHKYNVLFTDFHSNIHHDQLAKIENWYDHAKQTLDFWAVAYYPYGMFYSEGGMPVEDLYPEETLQQDWEKIRQFLRGQDHADFPVFSGYEWQGAGLDGDHNVFFKNEGRMIHPRRYEQLRQEVGMDAIAIPHHLAYALHHRGKNWETHNETFSPISEIYSAHGSSESAYTDLPMHRHIHMGPRTGGTSLFNGLIKGVRSGIIASGDNHIVPGVFGHGYAAVITADRSREAIWQALLNRHTYGVSANKMLLDYRANGYQMGDVIEHLEPGGMVEHEVYVEGGDAISRIELIKNNVVVDTYVHNGSWENKPLEGTQRFKFKIEFGWGPNTDVFKGHYKKQWTGSLKTAGTILSVENCFTSPRQWINRKENSADFSLTTYKSTQTGKWMGPSQVTLEGFIFEIEAPVTSDLELTIDGQRFHRPIRQILADTDIIVFYDEAKKLVRDAYGLEDYYRSDPFYHNAYKVRILRGVPADGYHAHCTFMTKMEKDDKFTMIKAYQRNGELAWSSPIFY